MESDRNPVTVPLHVPQIS